MDIGDQCKGCQLYVNANIHHDVLSDQCVLNYDVAVGAMLKNEMQLY